MKIDIDKLVKETRSGLLANIINLSAIFVACLCILILFIIFAPNVNIPDSSVFYTFPDSNEKLQRLTDAVNTYTEESFVYVLFLFCFLHLFLQSFAIPGPVFLSLISGAVFGR